MHLSYLGKEILAVEGRESRVWQICFSQNMISVENGMEEAGSKCWVDGCFQECSYQASLGFQLHIMDSKSTKRGMVMHHKLIWLEELVSLYLL